MDEGDGMRVSSSSEVDNAPGASSADVEDIDSSKTPFSRSPGFTSSTSSQSIKMLLNYNSVNGDCAKKDVNKSEKSVVGMDMYSESPDWLQDDRSRFESDSSSDISSKSSDSESSDPRLNYSFSKSSSNLSHRSASLQSETSDDSDDMSDSNIDDGVNKDENDINSRVETPNSQFSQSYENIPKSLEKENVDDYVKVNESFEYSQSDESFKKEENSSPVAPVIKNLSLDLSQSSDDSTVDSGRSLGSSLSGSISQDIQPQETSQFSEIHHNDTNIPAERNSNLSNALTENVDVPSVPDETSNSSFNVHLSEENSESGENSNPAKCTSEVSELGETVKESFPLSEESSVISPNDEEEKKPVKEENNSPLLSAPSDSSENFSETENQTPGQETSFEDLTEKSGPEVDKLSSVNVESKRLEDLNRLNSNINEMSVVKSCISSCFPKIECTREPNSKASDKIKSDDEISKAGGNFSIKYKGFKKISSIFKSRSHSKTFLRWNPFNPARKKDPKTGKYILQQNVVDDQDCSSLQPEYAQYLGLQPIVKFKCSYCGMSNFQSMSALNTHKMECKRTSVTSKPLVLDKNRAITIRRRVYMCSVCGSYKPRSEVFQHMLEIHKLYICLFDKCLKFCQSPEALVLHFREDHKVEPKYCSTHEDFQKEIPPNFYLLCVNCRKVFTELDDPGNHNCPSKPNPKTENVTDSNNSDRLYNTLNRVSLPTHFEPSSSQSWDIAKVTASLKLNKDITMKPLNELQSSDSCQFRNPNFEDARNISSQTTNKIAVDPCFSEALTKTTDNLNIKVPSDIEIKPLIPGEIHHQENKFEPTNGSAIEIFPIPQAQTHKPTRKDRTIIKRTIKKKRVVIGKKKKSIENSLLPTDILGHSEDGLIPPVSPPIIAPPPIMRSPSPVVQSSEPEPEQIHKEAEQPSKLDIEPNQGELPSEDLNNLSQNSNQENQSTSGQEPDTDSIPSAVQELNEIPEIKRSLSQGIFKIKLQNEMDSDGESDDSQKLSLVVDENTNNSEEYKKDESEQGYQNPLSTENAKNDPNEVPLASEDVAAMALTLDDKIENVPIQSVVKECVRTSCMSCNYCRHAVKIAVNGKQLALHLLSEHRYTPVKNETNDDVIRKLKGSLDTLQTMYFNAETYDSSDPSIHIPYDKESNFDCFQCSYVSSSHKDLYTHKRKFHTKSLLLCIMCKKNFFSYSELICHICTGTYCADPQVYSVDINFRCCFCRLDTIPSAFRLMVHLRKSHHTCDICLEICTDQQKLSTHMWKHKLNHLCYRCGIAYASKPDITKHLFWKHGTESVLCKKCLQKKWPHVYHFCIPPTSFICEECNTSFSKAVALKVHKRIHGNDYPYSCSQCDKKFVSKKLLSRHIDRHNAVILKKDSTKSPDNAKDEIINVTDVDNKDVFHNENSDSNKESDGKDKNHKKHKKEKDKKDKVLDVYDIPPLNLSSDSDSSDEDETQKSFPKGPLDNGFQKSVDPSKMGSPLFSDKLKAPDMPKLDGMLDSDDRSMESSSFLNLLKQDESGQQSSKRKPTASEPVSPLDSSVVNSLLPMGKDEIKSDPMDSIPNDHVDGIWENFYKTNPHQSNSNLPFPLCAMKSEVAYSIVMGDHNYCQNPNTEPIIKEDLPSTSNFETHLSDDKLEEITPIIPEKPQTPPPQNKDDEGENVSTPVKKKLKSPKKKVTKTPDDKNSSTSSDSSSDSDTSCSCATNCSCSSSSDSSSSSSSDSDSSTNEDKKDKRRKKKDKKLSVKSEIENETIKEAPRPDHEEEEVSQVAEPEDPPIRESELETDETTSDEEFYDRQPQIIANQLLAEKREKQINLVTPVNNGSASPVPNTPLPQQRTPTPPPTPMLSVLPQIPPPTLAQENIPPTEQVVEAPKPKPRAKRKRRVATPRTPKVDKPLPEPTFPKYASEPRPSTYSIFQQTPVARQKLTATIMGRSPSLPEASGSGPESDNTRLSKRRRVPNKFYGYSSGEDEDKPATATPKWRKIEMPLSSHQTPKLPPAIVHPPPMPRIQLTVPKQQKQALIIRRPYHKQSSKQKMQHHPTSSDSTDSGSDIDDRVPRPPTPQEQTAKPAVYCYCRCPYDEVSEMIACDDENCKIEWFHFECVGILVPPRGQWYCPDCRKARGLPT